MTDAAENCRKRFSGHVSQGYASLMILVGFLAGTTTRDMGAIPWAIGAFPALMLVFHAYWAWRWKQTEQRILDRRAGG